MTGAMNRLLVLIGTATLAVSAHADLWSNFDEPGSVIHYGGTIFDIQASGGNDLTLTGRFNLNLDVNSLDTSDTTESVAVYYREGSYLGHIANDGSNLGDWTLLGTGIANVAGDGNRSLLDVGSSLNLTAGQTYGLAIFALNGGAAGIGYRSGTGSVNVAPQNTFTSGELTVSGGVAKGFGLASNPFATHNGSSTQRLFAGEIEYTAAAPVPEPASMAALGLGALALIRRRKAAKK